MLPSGCHIFGIIKHWSSFYKQSFIKFWLSSSPFLLRPLPLLKLPPSPPRVPQENFHRLILFPSLITLLKRINYKAQVSRPKEALCVWMMQNLQNALYQQLFPAHHTQTLDNISCVLWLEEACVCFCRQERIQGCAKVEALSHRLLYILAANYNFRVISEMLHQLKTEKTPCLK